MELLILPYRVSTLKHPELADVLNLTIFLVFNLLEEFKCMPKFLAYITGHLWGAATVLT